MLVNESGMQTSMDRLRLRAPEGEQPYSEIPRNRGKNLTLIASISLHEIGEAMCIQGATEVRVFEVYVEHLLTPTLSKGQVAELDNLEATDSRG